MSRPTSSIEETLVPARSTDVVQGPNGPAYVDHYASADYAEALQGAGVVIVALNREGLTDEALSRQIGGAVMTDKPIIVIRMEPGLTTPKHLCEIAFDVVDFHPDRDVQTQMLGKVMVRLAGQLRESREQREQREQGPA